MENTTQKDRKEFVKRLGDDDKIETFGKTILLIFERIDDVEKPSIIGRILSAHIRGKMTYDDAMRIAAIVNRGYLQDLIYLKVFKDGTQGNNEAVADALFSIGLLSNQGIDGGSFSNPNSGGTIYAFNKFSKLLVKYGLQ